MAVCTVGWLQHASVGSLCAWQNSSQAWPATLLPRSSVGKVRQVDGAHLNTPHLFGVVEHPRLGGNISRWCNNQHVSASYITDSCFPDLVVIPQRPVVPSSATVKSWN